MAVKIFLLLVENANIMLNFFEQIQKGLSNEYFVQAIEKNTLKIPYPLLTKRDLSIFKVQSPWHWK